MYSEFALNYLDSFITKMSPVPNAELLMRNILINVFNPAGLISGLHEVSYIALGGFGKIDLGLVWAINIAVAV